MAAAVVYQYCNRQKSLRNKILGQNACFYKNLRKWAVPCTKVPRYFFSAVTGTTVHFSTVTAVLVPTFSFVSGFNNCKLRISSCSIAATSKKIIPFHNSRVIGTISLLSS